MTTITAVRLYGHGDPLAVEEIDLPEPAAGEVRVELTFAGVNPIDRYNALGQAAPDGPLPRTLGGEAAGVLAGAPVQVAGSGLGSTRDGVFATAANVPRTTVRPVPDGLDPKVVASAGIAGLTAWSVVVDRAGVGPDDRVLVLGAGGGVGLPTVSLAASLGATVWAQVGTPAKATAVGAAGAAAVLATDAAGLAEAVGDFAPTVVIDPLGAAFAEAVLPLIAPYGRLVVYGAHAGTDVSIDWRSLYRRHVDVLGYGGLTLTDATRTERLEQVFAALADGRMRIPVDRVVPLSRAAEAFDALAGRSLTGKVVLDLGAAL